MMNIFIVGPQLSEESELGVIMPLMMIQFMFPILAVFVAGEVTLRGKETLFIYRKTPSGVGRFVKARLIQGWLIVIPIAAAVTVLSTGLSPQTTLVSLLVNTGFGVLIAAGNVAVVLGLFLLIPAFSEKSVRFMVNVLIVIFISIGSFFGPLFGLMKIIPDLETILRLLYVLLLQTCLNWSIGIVLLYFGKRNLNRTE